MSALDPNHVEYTISTGHVQIIMDNGTQIPAYWAYPNLGRRLPGVTLVHDWWGLTDAVRRLAHQFAQVGYYVIVPDLFDGKVATTPREAMELIRVLGDQAYPRIDTAIRALEDHHQCNRQVAAVGIGMGGSLAFEAAIVRKDLEAAVSYYGFPQRYLGRFKDCKTPILAFYGSTEPHIPPQVIDKLRAEFDASTDDVLHRLTILNGVGHDFFSGTATRQQENALRESWRLTLDFLDAHLEGRSQAPKRVV